MSFVKKSFLMFTFLLFNSFLNCAQVKYKTEQDLNAQESERVSEALKETQKELYSELMLFVASPRAQNDSLGKSSSFRYTPDSAHSKFLQLCRESDHEFFDVTISSWAQEVDLYDINDKLCYCNIFCAHDNQPININWDYLWKELFGEKSLEEVKSIHSNTLFQVDSENLGGLFSCFKTNTITLKKAISEYIKWENLTPSEMILTYILVLNSYNTKILRVKSKTFSTEINKIKRLCVQEKHFIFKAILDFYFRIKTFENKTYKYKKSNLCICKLLDPRNNNASMDFRQF
ncbi:MAG: hypothetical protein P4L22_07640 [Candidatus Babeliales bacterium]|nr:hypothetical protein [Candidatus Babeliales bacterium]